MLTFQVSGADGGGATATPNGSQAMPQARMVGATRGALLQG